MRPQIEAVSVRGLFGDLDYDLEFSEYSRNDGLAFIYSDNGLGKTTLLWTIFHLLSSQPHGGHRTAVSRIPFRSITIELSQGVRVSAVRTEATAGPFKQILEISDDQIRVECDLPSDKKEANDETEQAYAKMCTLLRRYAGAVRLLSSDRRLVSNDDRSIVFEMPEEADEFAAAGSALRIYRHAQRQRWQPQKDVALVAAMKNAHDWIQRQATMLRDEGVAKTDLIYMRLLKQLSAAQAEARENAVAELSALRRDMEQLSVQAEDLNSYELSLDFAPTVRRAPTTASSAAA